MSSPANQPVPTSRVILAFATVYLVWGSTYFFISVAVKQIPPMLVGAFRFLTAGALLLAWCIATGEKVFVWKDIRPAIVSGLLLLLVGNGALVWAEQYLTSSLSAILLAAVPLWFVVLDKAKWRENFRSRETIIGLLVGFAGVILLFGEKLLQSLSVNTATANAGLASAADKGSAGGAAAAAHLAGANAGHNWQFIALLVLMLGSISWAAGSLYSKYKSTAASNSVNAGWQMLAAGIAFLPASWFSGELSHFHWHEVTMSAWLSVFYLVTMGSLAGYSAFVWLLKVRPATQVSTYAYVNPVVAVLLGTLFVGDHISMIQLLGLVIILISVLLVNLAKYRARPVASEANPGQALHGESIKDVQTA
jgi:drug/metabolite transporter (DMT)-like permease